MKNKQKKKQHRKQKISKLHKKASAWALREFLKLPHATLPPALLQQIANSRRQTIHDVLYEPDRIVIWLG
ncbi:MAG: hypothetical protein HYZ42_16580 [Bacteroidetes bacterium]|nr:hypothetical protein [Bacteroidota bacterium]